MRKQYKMNEQQLVSFNVKSESQDRKIKRPGRRLRHLMMYYYRNLLLRLLISSSNLLPTPGECYLTHAFRV